jgi:O-antigen ligase
MSDALSVAGMLAAALAAAAAIVLPQGRARSVAMLIALVLFPILILGDQWHSRQIVDLRHNSARLALLLAVGIAATAVLAAAMRRWPLLLPLAIVAALPFRIPLHAGGDTANLLVPLYLVIAAGVLSTALGRLGGWQQGWGVNPGAASRFSHNSVGESRAAPGEKPSPPTDPPSLLPYALAAVVVLYAVQALYSLDFSKSIQNLCFFFGPFSLAYVLLRDARWDRRLLVLVLAVIAVESVAFVVVGSVEYLSRSLFWNDQVIRSNEFHTYFRVNSVFWDPNIYGRYLALVIVVAMAALMWARGRRTFAVLTVLIGALWLGLTLTFSQSSFIALLAGLAVLAAIRWSWRWTLVAVGVGLVGAVLVVTLVGGKSISSVLERLNVDTSGRAHLISGGMELFGERPLWGYGAGSFQQAYREHRAEKNVPVTVSHTEPITVAAEQGLVGLVLYIALIVAALWTMGAGMWRGPPDGRTGFAGRAAVLAAFVALLVHTMAYAGFFEDPITWLLLAMAVSLAGVRREASEEGPAAPAAAPPAVGGAVEPTA